MHFSDVFSGTWKGTLGRNGLICEVLLHHMGLFWSEMYFNNLVYVQQILVFLPPPTTPPPPPSSTSCSEKAHTE